MQMISSLFMFMKPRCHFSFEWASLDLVRNAFLSNYYQFALNVTSIWTQYLKLDSEISQTSTFKYNEGSVLRKGIMSYVGGASEFTEPEIALVPSPIAILNMKNETSHFAATIGIPSSQSTVFAMTFQKH